ncbi:uncharacterized [Tachysurus ichikawai]
MSKETKGRPPAPALTQVFYTCIGGAKTSNSFLLSTASFPCSASSTCIPPERDDPERKPCRHLPDGSQIAPSLQLQLPPQDATPHADRRNRLCFT